MSDVTVILDPELAADLKRILDRYVGETNTPRVRTYMAQTINKTARSWAESGRGIFMVVDASNGGG